MFLTAAHKDSTFSSVHYRILYEKDEKNFSKQQLSGKKRAADRRLPQSMEGMARDQTTPFLIFQERRYLWIFSPCSHVFHSLRRFLSWNLLPGIQKFWTMCLTNPFAFLTPAADVSRRRCTPDHLTVFKTAVSSHLSPPAGFLALLFLPTWLPILIHKKKKNLREKRIFGYQDFMQT